MPGPQPPWLNCRGREKREQMLEDTGGLGVLAPSDPGLKKPGEPEDTQSTLLSERMDGSTVSGPASPRTWHPKQRDAPHAWARCEYSQERPPTATGVRETEQRPPGTYKDKKLIER